jgi:hypothetical protein
MSILSKDGYSYQTLVCQARGAKLRSEPPNIRSASPPIKAKITTRPPATPSSSKCFFGEDIPVILWTAG